MNIVLPLNGYGATHVRNSSIPMRDSRQLLTKPNYLRFTPASHSVQLMLFAFSVSFTLSNSERVNVEQLRGLCDGNSMVAVAECKRSFPDQRIPDRRVFSNVLPKNARRRFVSHSLYSLLVSV